MTDTAAANLDRASRFFEAIERGDAAAAVA
jgi:hypothetical protein